MSFREFPIATFIKTGGVFGFSSAEFHSARFSMGCKKAGYVGNATRLWAAINQAAVGTIWAGISHAPNYPTWLCQQFANWKMAIEIVDFPIKNCDFP